MRIKNIVYDNKSNLSENAKVFCKQIDEHSKYELVFNDESSNITTKRTHLVFGQVIIYEYKKDNKFIPDCCYNFFATNSELAVIKDSSFDNHTFNIIYFVVPNINYHDLTLLMDQSHELWCNIMGNINSQAVFTKHLNALGYKYLGKIYRIIFSDLNQFEEIKEDKVKLYNILAAEEYKNKEEYSHQIELSENSNEYSYSTQESAKDFILAKKENFLTPIICIVHIKPMLRFTHIITLSMKKIKICFTKE
jgi:hypothetical protein